MICSVFDTEIYKLEKNRNNYYYYYSNVCLIDCVQTPVRKKLFHEKSKSSTFFMDLFSAPE